MKHTDLIIVGGGVIGMAVAYFLSRDKSYTITVIDKKKRGNASYASAGGLWPIGESVGLGCGVIFFKTLSKRRIENLDETITVERPHQLPPYFLDFSLKSNAMFPALWEELKEEANVDFKFERTGLKFVMYDKDDEQYAKQIADSIPHLKKEVVFLDQKELLEEEPYITPDAIGAMTFLTDHQVNPFLLVQAYREGARRNGVRFIENTEVSRVMVEHGRVTGIETDQGHKLYCNLLINAAGAWAGEIAKMVGVALPVTPIKGQIVLSERLPDILRSCFSTSDCYLAQKDNGEILIGSTTENLGFNTNCSFSELQALCKGAVKLIPQLGQVAIKRTWAGLRPGSPDEIPILGQVPGLKGYLNACGHFRTGIVTSAITGKIMADIISDRQPPVNLEPFLYERFLHPSRIEKKYALAV